MMKRACGLMTILAAAPILAQPAVPPGSGPADPAVATNLRIGLEEICAPFLRNSGASTDELGRVAGKAGYEVGAPDPYGSVGQPIADAPPAMAFHKAAASGEGASDILVFLTTVPTACQIRAKGDAAAWSAYLSTMPKRHGKLIATAAITPETTYSHEVYTGGVNGLPKGYTLFVNRWVGPGSPKNGVYTIINVLPDS